MTSALHAQAQEAQAQQAHAQALTSMATAAHELRNPLSPIRLAAEMLGEARGDLTRFTKLRDIIEAEVVHIARLVDDLLDGSRMASGKLSLERADTALAPVLETAVEACRPTIESRQQQLVVELPPDDAMSLHADHTRLVQVFTNLLDNASKYTPEGGRIHLTAARTLGALTVRIHDTGIGITADALLNIFDMFFQDAAAAVQRPGGLGIGLAIVSELVEAHGGTVMASSDGEGQGSVFEVTRSAASTVQVLHSPGGAPTLNVPSSNLTGAYTVGWTAVSGATRYELEERVGTATWTRIHDASAASKAVSGKVQGTWSYRVRACNAAGCGGWSSTASVAVTRIPGSTPALTVPATNTTGGYTVSWTAVTHAATYQLEERLGTAAWANIHNAAATSRAVSGKATGTWEYRGASLTTGAVMTAPAVPQGLGITVQYRVRACSVLGCGPYATTAQLVNRHGGGGGGCTIPPCEIEP